MSEDERAIREMITTWFAASKSGDTQTVLGLMTDDVVFLVPGRPPFGKMEFAEAAHAMKNVRLDGISTIEELNIQGTWAYVRCRIELTITPPGASTAMKRAGHTLTILRKDAEGQWRLARDANLLAEQK